MGVNGTAKDYLSINKMTKILKTFPMLKNPSFFAKIIKYFFEKFALLLFTTLSPL